MTRRPVLAALAAVTALTLAACASPFSEHAKDVQDAFARDFHSMHRKFDRYVLRLDWDDPYHEWHDESYATGPTMH